MSIMIWAFKMQNSVPADDLYIGGALAMISLIILLSIALLISDSKYWNSWASSTFDICLQPLLITFLVIIAYKITIIL